MWKRYTLTLPSYRRGFHLITDQVVRACEQLDKYHIGLMNLFLCHTSASLMLNENADPSVREDFENFIDKLVPENEPYFTHIYEGSDDMPAHIKSSLLGNSLTIPIYKGDLSLGVWQGIYLAEHRNRASGRKIIITLSGRGFFKE